MHRDPPIHMVLAATLSRCLQADSPGGANGGMAAVAVAGANDRDIVAVPGGSDALVAAPAGLLLRAADA